MTYLAQSIKYADEYVCVGLDNISLFQSSCLLFEFSTSVILQHGILHTTLYLPALHVDDQEYRNRSRALFCNACGLADHVVLGRYYYLRDRVWSTFLWNTGGKFYTLTIATPPLSIYTPQGGTTLKGRDREGSHCQEGDKTIGRSLHGKSLLAARRQART